ncbi:hypothetical protein O1L60_03560 [Streptomyces diastatochromogenes]|nr:hypothetical protein [Streptomyces diastatochromogenes]
MHSRRTLLSAALGTALAVAAPPVAARAATGTAYTGTTYYVDSAGGSDTADGTSTGTPGAPLPG